MNASTLTADTVDRILTVGSVTALILDVQAMRTVAATSVAVDNVQALEVLVRSAGMRNSEKMTLGDACLDANVFLSITLATANVIDGYTSVLFVLVFLIKTKMVFRYYFFFLHAPNVEAQIHIE